MPVADRLRPCLLLGASMALGGCLQPYPLPSFHGGADVVSSLDAQGGAGTSSSPDIGASETAAEPDAQPDAAVDRAEGCGMLGRDCPAGFDCTEAGTCESATEVWVPAGPFLMGCNEVLDQDCSDNEYDPHEVTPGDYFIDRLEVTELALRGAGGPQLPALYVTWGEARAYCQGVGSDLCTEAQWEKAARGGCEFVAGDCAAGSRTWPWGETSATCERAVMGDGCGTDAAWPVGSKPKGASPYGALDMAGNAYEWVSTVTTATTGGRRRSTAASGPTTTARTCTGWRGAGRSPIRRGW